MKKITTKKDKKSFAMAFSITFCMLLLCIGLLLVDYQGRKLSFGDDSPVFQVTEYSDGTSNLLVNAFGEIKEYEITKLREIYNKILDFCCIPHN